MDNTLLERLDILSTSGQITEAAKKQTLRAISIVEDEYKIELSENNASAFVTHFAVACTRIQKGEPVSAYRSNIEEAVKRYPELYSQSKHLFEGVVGEVPEAEYGFITMYLCAILEKEL
jgi:transcriptional antiterminator